MSFEPVTYYHLRCDGATTHGQCAEILMIRDYDEDGLLIPALSSTADVTSWRPTLKAYGWLVGPDGRLHCRKHVAAAEHTVKAALEGLPFADVEFVPVDQAFPEEP